MPQTATATTATTGVGLSLLAVDSVYAINPYNTPSVFHHLIAGALRTSGVNGYLRVKMVQYFFITYTRDGTSAYK